MGFIEGVRKVVAKEKHKAQLRTRYWEYISRNLGGGAGVKAAVIQELSGMGVVAALVLTVAAAGLALGPSNFNEANLYNDNVSLALTILLAASFGFSLYTINGTFGLIAHSLKVREDRFVEWVQFWAGNPCWQYWSSMTWSLVTLTASMLTMVYLLKGGVHCWAATAVIGGILLVERGSAVVLDGHMEEHHVFGDDIKTGDAGADGGTSDMHGTVVVTQAKPTQRAAANLPDVVS